MNRREILQRTAIGVALLAGCTGNSGSPGDSPTTTNNSDSPDDSPTNSPETSSPEEMPPRYKIDTSVAQRTKEGLRLSVSVDSDTITPSQAASITLSVTNTEEDTRQIFDGPIWPFGVLYAVSEQKESQFLIWREEYENNQNVEVTDGNVSVAQIGVQKPVDADETVSRTYTIPHDTQRLGIGTYNITNGGAELRVGNVQFQVQLEITSAETTEANDLS